jgi:Spy/CpxP family protein refolding chaperone
MSIKKQWMHLTATAVIVAGVLIAGAAAIHHSQGRAGSPEQRRERVQKFIAEKLSFTDQQKQESKAILDEAHQKAEPIRQQLKEGHQAIADAVKAGKGDEELQALSKQEGELAGRLIGIHTRAFSKIYALLTPEQRTKAEELHQRFMSRSREHFGSGFAR